MALELGEEGEKDGDVSKLTGRVWAVKDARRGEARSAGSSRRRRGASAAILGVRAGDDDAWQGRAEWGPVWVNPVMGRRSWPGRRRVAGGLALGRH